MSRLYDNKPLSTLPVKNVQWPTQWSADKYQSGHGVILEGTIKNRHRVVICSSNAKVKYFIFGIEMRQAHKRVYDSTGTEVEPNFTQTQKVRTGFLHSSYKTEAKGLTDKLSCEELKNLINTTDLCSVVKADDPKNVMFWIPESSLANIELLENDQVRLKTKGNGPFIETVAKVDQQTNTVSNYAGGEQVGASWTDKVMAVKQQEVVARQENEGVDDDEWDD